MTKWFRSGSRPSAMLSFIVKDPSGEHRVTDTSTVPRLEVTLPRLVTCFLFIAPSLAAGREAGGPPQRLQLGFLPLVYVC